MGKILKDKIAISGTTGFVGKNLKNFFTRNNVKYKTISRLAIQKNKLLLISNCNCFVHLVGIGIETEKKSFEEVNVELTKNIVDVCKKSKIKKIIYFSGLGVSSKSTSDYFISKFNAERLIIKSGLDYTIFRPSYIIGKDDYLTRNFKKQIRKKKILIPGSGKYIIQPISIQDVCYVVNLALQSRIFSKKIIDLVGPEKISFIQFAKNSALRSNSKIEKISIKKSFVSALTEKEFPYGVEDLNILLGNFEGNFERLRKISKIEFTKIKSI